MPVDILVRTGSPGDDYVGWSPTPCSLVTAFGGPPLPVPPFPPGPPSTVKVTLTSRALTAQGGRVQFSATANGPYKDKLVLAVMNSPAARNYPFFVRGKFGKPSSADKDCEISASLKATPGPAARVVATRLVMVRVRKNANSLSVGERDRFLAALATVNNHGAGVYQLLRDLHVAGANRDLHGGPWFLPWHRAYLLDLERRLQAVDPSVSIPYWKFDAAAPNIFTADFMGVTSQTSTAITLGASNPLALWASDGVNGIQRRARPPFSPSTNAPVLRNEADTVNLGLDFGDIRAGLGFSQMEGDPHGSAHASAFGGGFITSIPTAPRDPLFFLLHANVDRLWAKWQWVNNRFNLSGAGADSTYSLLGNQPNNNEKGHYQNSTLWPWDGDFAPPRTLASTLGSFPGSPVLSSPGASPALGQMVDYLGRTAPAAALGFCYDDIPFS